MLDLKDIQKYGGKAYNFLVHGLMRLIKKADVSVMVLELFSNKMYSGMKSLEDKVRIISNGKEAVVLKEI